MLKIMMTWLPGIR